MRRHAERSPYHSAGYEHLKQGIAGHWKTFLFYGLASTGVLWGLRETANFFYPHLDLNNSWMLAPIVFVSVLVGLFRSIANYRKAVPLGMENETAKIQAIVRAKNGYWQYALAHALIEINIEKIDRDFEDPGNNKTPVKTLRSLNAIDYCQWIQTRPADMMAIVKTTIQLLFVDLLRMLNDDKELDVAKLLSVIDLIKELYIRTYSFEVEGRQVAVPARFQLVYEIQSKWSGDIRDRFHQILSILKSIAERPKGGFNPDEEVISFKGPSRMDEFHKELERIKTNMA